MKLKAILFKLTRPHCQCYCKATFIYRYGNKSEHYNTGKTIILFCDIDVNVVSNFISTVPRNLH